MKALLNKFRPLLLLAVLVLAGCSSSSILHKDGMKEVVKEGVTEPLVGIIDEKADALIEDVDDLNLDELVESSNDLVEQTERSMEKLTELVEEVKNTAEVSTETLEQITETLKTISSLVNKLETTAESSTQLINTANDLLTETKTLIPELQKVAKNTNEILPEIRNLIASLNETVEKVNVTIDDAGAEIRAGTTESLWIKILPAVAFLLAVLVGVFFIVRAIKKK